MGSYVGKGGDEFLNVWILPEGAGFNPCMYALSVLDLALVEISSGDSLRGTHNTY